MSLEGESEVEWTGTDGELYDDEDYDDLGYMGMEETKSVTSFKMQRTVRVNEHTTPLLREQLIFILHRLAPRVNGDGGTGSKWHPCTSP